VVPDLCPCVPTAWHGGLNHADERGGHPPFRASLGRRLDQRRQRHSAGPDLCGHLHHINPPSNIETIDPNTLRLSGEFTEGNLGTRVAADGQVTSRIVATQFAFQPPCIVVPIDRPVTLRLATPDVIHGILVTGTNVNTMVVPGYVSQVHTVFTRTGDLLMPCHEGIVKLAKLDRTEPWHARVGHAAAGTPAMLRHSINRRLKAAR
jgi:Cytochrome C oxidase subunit II, periplasmic domain